MKNHASLMFTFILLIVLISSCQSVKISTDYDKGRDFNAYRTFYFMPETDQLPMNDLNKRRLKTSIEKTLMDKGFQPVENGDFAVDIQLHTRQKQSATTYTNYMGGFGRRGYRWGGGMSTSHTSINDYVVGTMFINLVDNEKNELIWQGKGEGTVNFDEKKREEKLEHNVARILKDFPPKLK